MLGSKENKGKGSILKSLKSDMTKFGDKSMHKKAGSVNDSPTRGSTPKVDKPGGSSHM